MIEGGIKIFVGRTSSALSSCGVGELNVKSSESKKVKNEKFLKGSPPAENHNQNENMYHKSKGIMLLTRIFEANKTGH